MKELLKQYLPVIIICIVGFWLLSIAVTFGSGVAGNIEGAANKMTVMVNDAIQKSKENVGAGNSSNGNSVNGSNSVTSVLNEHGFYYNRFYASYDQSMGLVFYEDSCINVFSLVTESGTNEWCFVGTETSLGISLEGMLNSGMVISSDGSILTIDGSDFVLQDIDIHGIYFDNKYSISWDNGNSLTISFNESGAATMLWYENGVNSQDILQVTYEYRNFAASSNDSVLIEYCASINGSHIFIYQDGVFAYVIPLEN